MPRHTRLLATAAVILGLAACVSGRPPVETAIDGNGRTTYIESDSEQCKRACNEDNARCMDTRSANSNPVAGAPSDMFGASSQCREALKSCMKGCKGR